jgi:hypothetical protein
MKWKILDVFELQIEYCIYNTLEEVLAVGKAPK